MDTGFNSDGSNSAYSSLSSLSYIGFYGTLMPFDGSQSLPLIALSAHSCSSNLNTSPNNPSSYTPLYLLYYHNNLGIHVY